MYTSYIGQKFLDLYNRKMVADFTAERFFDEIMFPLFFNDERHLMHVANSPFFQNPSPKELAARSISKPELQYEKLKQKIQLAASDDSPEIPDASIFVGFAANGPDQTTAGQVTTMNIRAEAEEIYASWIGNALAARVEGSQCLLFDVDEVLWHIYEGWSVYRRYMKPLADMDGRQIETWNGYWLAGGRMDKPPQPQVKGSKLETTPWLKVVARVMEWKQGVLPVYIFSLGQTNTTYGFINMHLPALKRLQRAKVELRERVFAAADEAEDKFWETYVPEDSLRDVCQLGEIGLRALRPEDYRKLIESPFAVTKFNPKLRQSFYHIQIWLTAMLNNKQELQQLAVKLANALVATEEKGTGKARGKNTDLALSKALFDAKGYASFTNALSELV